MPAGSQLNPLIFHCPSCAGALSVPAERAGVTGPCPFCRQTIRSPEAAHLGRIHGAGGLSMAAPLQPQPRVSQLHSRSYPQPLPPIHLQINPRIHPEMRPQMHHQGVRHQPRHPEMRPQPITHDAVASPDRESFGAGKGLLEIAQTWRTDESWKERHRELARRFYKRDRRERFFSIFVRKETGIAVAVVFSCIMGVVVVRHFDAKDEVPVREFEKSGSIEYVEAQTSIAVPAPASKAGASTGAASTEIDSKP